MSAAHGACARGPGQIDDDLYLLGDSGVPVYLLRTGATEWALIEGGVSASAAAVWDQLLAIVGAPSHVHHWLITHKHYDHCALLPWLAPRLPRARIVASSATAASWRNPKAQALIDSLNARLGPAPAGWTPLPWEEIDVKPAADGDLLVLGPNHALRVIGAPGHANDQIVFYDERRARLFASDALGERNDDTGEWHPLVFDDYALYLRSVETLAALPVRQLIPGHGGMYTGAAATNGAADALRACRRLEARIRSHCGDADHAHPEHPGHRAHLDLLARALHREWAPQSEQFVPADLHLASMRRMGSLIAAATSSTSWSQACS